VKRGTLCGIHLISEKPDHDWYELRLYNPDVGWPDISTVLSRVKKVKNGKDFHRKIKLLEQVYMFDNHPRTYLICVAELFFINYYLDFNTGYWQEIVQDLVVRLKPYKFLSDYLELFRKKFDQSFRLECQKKCIDKVLTQGLGKDCAKLILEHL